MFGFVKDGIVNVAAAIGASRAGGSQARRALVIPPAGPGSVGDAAMLTSTIATLRARGYEEVDILQVERGKSWSLDAQPDNLVAGYNFVDYGSRLNLAALLLRMSRYSDLLCIGADILDGIYDEVRMSNRLELLHEAANMGVRTTILGSSFSDHPTQRCVALIRKLPKDVRIFARDEFSHERMVDALKRPIDLSADVAFLLEPSQSLLDGHPAMAWLEAERAANRPIIALNANNLHEAEHPTLVSDYGALANRLIDAGAAILLVPHDSRTERSDQFIAGEILASLPPEKAAHAFSFHAETPGQLKALLGHADLLVTGRMHAAIIALGSHTPAMSFAYANKFEGLYRHLDLEPAEMILTLADLHAKPEETAQRVLGVLARSAELRSHVATKIGPLQKAAARNFDFAGGR